MMPDQAKRVAAAIRDLISAVSEQSVYQETPARHVCGAASAYSQRVAFCQQKLERELAMERNGDAETSPASPIQSIMKTLAEIENRVK
jgi:hypothetical protein